jgi:hypothetical protein
MDNQQTFQLRWLFNGQHVPVLQCRSRPFVVDASGAFCGLGEWCEWATVPGFVIAQETPPVRFKL